MLKTFYVFNIAQIDGLTFDPPEESDIITEAFHRSAFELALNADIRSGAWCCISLCSSRSTGRAAPCRLHRQSAHTAAL